MRRPSGLHRALLAGVWLASAAVPFALAQGRGPGGPPPGGPGGGMGGGGMNGGGAPFPGGDTGRGGPSPSIGQGSQPANPPRGGLQFGPPGQRWWDDKSFAKSLKLRPEQQTRMDAIFEQNRTALVSRYQTLEQAESQMDRILKDPRLDEATLFTQIDRIAQARADLEKANTHYLLQLRKEMDPDQIARLEKQR